jgi:hypothetical protein
MSQSPRQFGHVFRPFDIRQREFLTGGAAFLGFCLGSNHRSIAFWIELLIATKLLIVDLRYTSSCNLSMLIPENGRGDMKKVKKRHFSLIAGTVGQYEP